ncbi:lytic transglycosylase domain-containing protein [Ramlibacter rhizophilus]|uniref:lytic transglycosylase domain-containing protein n=1 Tax=Ramlibacter rhizophilus TaxID=1781167 RepID=UPI001F0F3D0C|nr:lytic transglycosylase domain-containing protein [Ramlibacter rhizophilus]
MWGYVDDHGVAHVATEKRDARYELFLRGGGRFDTRTPEAADPEPTRLEAARPDDGTQRLLAFFDISPGYKAVRPHLREAASAQRIDYELLKAVITAESGFDARAVSPKGAVGLMQVMPATAERWGLRAAAGQDLPQRLTDPRTNIRIGARYLRHLIDLFPDRLDLALAAYNAGEGAVQGAGNRIPDFRETQQYVKSVLRIYEALKPPALQAAAQGARRVRMVLPGPVPEPARGGAIGRGNMPASLAALPPYQNYSD